MGTEYVIHSDDHVEISLNEMSNLFELSICGDSVSHYTDAVKPMSVTHDQLSPGQVVKMAVRMLQVASYWMDDTDFDRKLLLELKDRKMLKDIQRAIGI